MSRNLNDMKYEYMYRVYVYTRRRIHASRPRLLGRVPRRKVGSVIETTTSSTEYKCRAWEDIKLSRAVLLYFRIKVRGNFITTVPERTGIGFHALTA